MTLPERKRKIQGLPKGVALYGLMATDLNRWLPVRVNEDGELVIAISTSDGELMIAQWGSGAGEIDDVRMDAMTNTLQMIDYAHHEVHGGSSFGACTFTGVELTNQLDAGQTRILCFKTPAGTKRAHMIIQFAANGAGHIDVVESPTWNDSSGTLVTIFNRKRDETGSLMEQDQATGAFQATNQVILNPNNFAGGTVVDTSWIFGEKEKSTGDARGVQEVILKPATQYGIRYYADADSNSMFMKLDWYEHTDKH